jgi:hypothetical protein
LAGIFISFIHEENRVAEAVSRFLRKHIKRTDVFLASDQWTVYAGEDWLKRIKEELASAKVVILLLSTASVARPWVNFEAGAAWLTDKVIIPVCFGGLRKDGMPKPYSSLQALSLDDEDGPYYLLSSIYHHMKDDLGLTPPPFTSDDPDVADLRASLK